ncbi:uncharacterized protein LOC108742911 isoform X2 [Agrilus planipennis]|uniref:Chloride channel CLIC-like protein 1 n=1 Tax=Agrilus planipennis TaxID=224129 RepID=A0A1W4XN12_AGRPL|nr:uncharacterized protein LOC108742911 isoform X2 [Agrilus planipennis]
MTLFLIFILLKCSVISSSQNTQNWIDPHEIVTTDTSVFNPEKQRCVYSSSCAEEKLILTHYKRLINLFLNSVTANRDDYSNYSGQLTIEMSTNDYNYLKSFAKSSDIDAASLRKVDSILTNSFAKSPQEYFFDSIVGWTDQLYFKFYNRTTGILLVLLFMCIISYKLLRAKLNIWTVIGYLIFIGWIVDFAFTWMKLYQEAEINKMADSLRYGSVPANCDPNKMSIWNYIWSTLSTDTECRNYHHTMYKDHFWSIAPLTVFSHQFGIVILTPASLIGKALGSFSVAVLDVLPFYAKIVVFPLLLIFTAILICIIFSFLTNTSFGFNLLHVIQFNFGNHERRVITDSLSGENLRHLLNTIQRNAIENVEIQNVHQI